MKLIESVRPVSNAKRAELEQELEEEKARFKNASQEAVDAIRTGLSVKTLIDEHPVEAAIALLIGGFAIARALQQRRRRNAEPTGPDLP
jgi:hypothetical protein